MPVISLQRSEIHVEALAVVVGAEVVEPGLGARPWRAARRRRAGTSGAIVAIMSRICCASGLKRGSARSSRWTTAVLWLSVTATYVTLSYVMTTDLGRPRDLRIDNAVLRATVELLGKSGYADLSVDAIARRAGTSKPAIYRRWPSKAHLVHEAVVPDRSEATELPDTGSLAGDVREMVRRIDGRADHACRAGGNARDCWRRWPRTRRCTPSCWTASATSSSRGMTDRLDDAVSRGEVRPDVTAAELVEAIAGITLLALLTRNASTRRRLGRAHRHPDHERNQRMTDDPRVDRRLARAARHPWRTGPLLPRGRPGGHRRPAHRRRLPHARDDARRRVRHLPLRRSQPADVGRGQLAVPAGPALGWRQHRRLLLHVPGRPEAPLPHQRQQG